jgi:hypothetical protein
MHELVAMLEKYQPGISATFRPAPQADIDQLIAATPKPVPGAYLRFLHTMGLSCGDLVIDHGNANLTSDLRWSTLAARTWLAEGRFLYIGDDSSPSANDYFLDQAAPFGEDDCMVVYMSLDRTPVPRPSPAFIGLEEMLFLEGFVSLRSVQFDNHRELRPPDGVVVDLQRVNLLAKTLGFARQPRVTHSALHDRGDAALWIRRDPVTSFFSCILSGDSDAEVERLAAEFATVAGLVVDEVHPL